MFDSILYYIVACFIGLFIIGLYVSVVNIVIQAMRPQKKYTSTSSFDPAFPAWVGSIFVMICVSTVISIQGTNIPFKKYILLSLVALIFLTVGLISNTARHTIHKDDPELKLNPLSTITNTTAACIPIIVSVLAASGIAGAVGISGTVTTAATLFFILAVPSAIGSVLTMLFARSASNPAYIYGSVSTIGLLVLGTVYLIPSNQ